MAGPWEAYAKPEQAAPAGPWSEFQGNKQPAAEPVSDARMAGRAYTQEPATNIVAGLANAAQGAGFNLLDETVGTVAAYNALRQRLNPFTDAKPGISDAYRNARDTVRGMVEQYRTENPVASVAGQLFGALAQGGGLSRLFGTGGGALLNIGRGAAAGGIEGAARGLGQAENIAAIPSEVLSEGGMGAAGGAAGTLAAQGAGMIGRAIAPRLPSALGVLGNAVPGLNAGMRANDDVVADIARRRVAEAFMRDQRTPEQVAARINRLGQEARIADSAGASTRQLLDTQATLPGQTAQQVEQAIRSRQAGRAGRLIEAAEEGLGATGKRLTTTLQSLDAQRRAAAEPLYDVVRNTTVQVDDELRGLLERARSAVGPAKKIAEITGEAFEIPSGPTAKLSALDQIKRGIYALEEKNINPETGKVNAIGKAYQDLRRALVAKLDDLTTDQATGQSFYKAARDAYAGPTELRNAAREGFRAMQQDVTRFRETLAGLSDSEREAFRIGAMEAMRNKFGTMAGQTAILKMWREPATQERMRELFPTIRNYRDFAVTVGAEERLRQLESVGRGSQTARRLAAAEDQGDRIMSDLGSMAQGATTPGGVATLLKSAKDLYSRLDTPETVRNEIGRILLLQNGQSTTTRNEIARLSEVMRRYAASNTAVAAASGATGGTLATQE